MSHGAVGEVIRVSLIKGISKTEPFSYCVIIDANGEPKIGIRIFISRVGNGVGNTVESVHISFIFNAGESLGGDQAK